MDTFFSLGLSRAITDCLAREGITTPTRIQLKAIPAALKGADVIGRSQTGTGKTSPTCCRSSTASGPMTTACRPSS